MKKVICDICGTMYPETESKCPLCGGARRPEDAVVSVEESEVQEKVSSRTPAKRSNKGLVVTIVVLLVAILAVSAYIAIRFLGLAPSSNKPQASESIGTSAPAEESTEPPKTVPCTSMALGNNVIELNAAGSAWLLDVKVQPEKTTDTVTFVSSDPSIATVTDQGRVTAVAPGQAIITVTCGEVEQQCRVVCDFAAETTEATKPDPEETTEPAADFTLNRDDITFAEKGESFRFSVSGLSSTQITWSSDNSSVATIENGTVTAVGSGTTKIHATYGGKKATCIIRCSFKNEDDQQTTEPTENKGVRLSHDDVTISEGESFTIRLLDGDGSRVDVSFSSSDSEVCNVSGSTVTGGASGMAKVSATYEGVTYSCIVRVR